MEMTLTILDPTDESAPDSRPLARRTGTPKTIALLDISKSRGDVFLDELERQLSGRGATILRVGKPTFTKPAPADLRRDITTRCDAVIEALAD
jgi:hypothetical protein